MNPGTAIRHISPVSAARWACLRVLSVLTVCLALAGGLPATALAKAAEALKLGLLPIWSTRTLLTNYQPLRDYLERHLQRPVVIHTAADFRAFHRETEAGTYDLVVTASHLARLAQTDLMMQPLATYRAVNRAMIVMAKARPVSSVSELRGQRLAIFDPLALNVRVAINWLERQGLRPGHDFAVVDAHSHNGVAHVVASGKALLGVTAPAGMRVWPQALRDELSVFAEMPPVPALIWMAHPRLGQHTERIKALLLRFPDSPEGREFLAKTGYEGLREVTAAELRALDPVAAEAARLLRANP
ncbi:MAG: phosphate/phosphite/phosphonate ABC transporter substrate-binding protein [Thiobacillaceae bacterium]